MAHLFPAHFGQFVQINVDAVEPDPIGRPTLRMQDLLHQHVEEELDAAEETTRAGAWAQRRPSPRGGDVARGVRCGLPRGCSSRVPPLVLWAEGHCLS